MGKIWFDELSPENLFGPGPASLGVVGNFWIRSRLARMGCGADWYKSQSSREVVVRKWVSTKL